MEPHGTADEVAVDVDVDAVLLQLKQAKDKELRLRAEKERVRKELDALRTGDLWVRETATRRELEAVQARRRSLQDHEAAETERLRVLDTELRAKEATVQKRRREPLDVSVAFQQAASRIVAPVALSAGEQPTAGRALIKLAVEERVLSTPEQKNGVEHQVSQIDSQRRRSSNQEPDDAVAALAFSIDLEKQQSRIKRLEQQLEQSKAQSASRVWDLPLATGPLEPSPVSQPQRSVESASPAFNSGRNSMETSCPKAVIKGDAPVALASQSLPTHVQAHTSGMTPTMIPTPYPSGVPSIPSQLYQAPQVAPTPSALVPPYSMFSPQAVPLIAPTVYSPWSYAPPFGYPPYGYAPPLMVPQPSVFAPVPSFPPQPFQSTAEQDVVALQCQLDSLRKKEQLTEEDKEFSKVQELLSGLQHQVTQLSRARSPDGTLEATDSLPETLDAGLKSIKRQHLESLLKVRNERDLLEEQDKLEEMQERIEKRREERKRDSTREALVAKQKQELMALRLQRAVANMEATKQTSLLPDQDACDRPYDPNSGVLLCWDYASGLLASVEKAQLMFAVYDGKIPRSPIKTLSSKECESEGPSHKRALFAANRVVKPLPASSDVVVVVEVSSVTSSDATTKPTVRRLGWAAVGLFGQTLQLKSAWVKLKLATSPTPDPTTVSVRAFTGAEGEGGPSDVYLHFRVVHGEFEEQAQATPVNPDADAGRYRPPPDPGRHREAPAVNQDKAPTVSQDTAPLKRQSLASLAPSTAAPTTTISAVGMPPPSRDFIDIERLRLLSSSSTAGRPPSESLRPRSTLSAVPRNRVGGGGALPVVPEATTFDVTSSTSPWIESQQRRSARTPFQPGDAFDVYVDGARFLPDNVNVTKVTIAGLTADRTKITPLTADASQVAQRQSDACCPVYNLYVEYREKAFDPTLTLVLRLDTLDGRTKQPVILAYAVFSVFLDADTHTQPTQPNCTHFELNAGALQLPLYTNAVLNDPAAPLSAASAVANVPRLPCATLLIRVKSAATSEDGLQVLSRTTVPPSEWTALRLEEAAPPYSTGTYDSSASVPTSIEMRLYPLRDLDLRKRKTTVEQTLSALSLDASAVNSLFPAKPAAFIDLHDAFRYQPEIGFRVSIDGLHNIKLKAGSFCRVLYSVSPPGAFYQSVRLTSGVHCTTTTDWTSLPTSPEFQDGFVAFRDVAADTRLMLIIDIRAVTKNPKTNAYASQPLAWTFVSVLNDMSGSVAAGSFQVPLFSGDVKLEALASPSNLSMLVEDIAAERKKAVLSFMDGASVFVRLDDPQVPTLTPLPPITSAALSSMTPPKALPRYLYDGAKVALAKKKSPLSKLLPPGVGEKQMDADLNAALVTELGVHRF